MLTLERLDDKGGSPLSVFLGQGGKDAFDRTLLCIQTIQRLCCLEVKIHGFYIQVHGSGSDEDNRKEHIHSSLGLCEAR